MNFLLLSILTVYKVYIIKMNILLKINYYIVNYFLDYKTTFG